MVSVIALILITVAVAFFTLIERKVLAYIHMRKGPNKPGAAGLLVPFADAAKLFTKQNRTPTLANTTLFHTIILLVMGVPMLLWFTAPLRRYAYDMTVMILIALAVSRIGVYGTLGAGWARNSKYSFVGGIRAVAHTTSYEVSLTVIILGSVIFFYFDLGQEKSVMAAGWLAPLACMIVVRVLAETNRSPFDFAEGESELVSGFNTEYARVLFTILFLAEYMSILFISILTSIVYLRAGYTDLLAATILVRFIYVWARGTLPRFRYDQLMYLAWKAFLPTGLCFLILGVILSRDERP